jgi:hypothetical protein
VIFERVVRRDNGETSTWPHVSTRVQGRLDQAAKLRGVEGVSPGRNLQLIPYATARSFRALDDRGEPRFVVDDFDPDVGLDLKKVFDDRLVVDLTVNPDFSQIESDQPQVTVNQRFEVFFPERRPFFLENADFFATPIDLLFTRRIGDPRLGGRVTGKIGRWGIGGLLVDDEGPGERVGVDDPLHGERALFGIARLSRDLGRQSRLGALFVGRELGGERNQVLSVDGRIKWSDRWASSLQAAASSEERRGEGDETGHAAYFNLSRSGRHLNYVGQWQETSGDFRADAGFIPRTGVREMAHFMSLFYWPRADGALVRWGPEVFTYHVWDEDGELLDETYEASLEWELPGQTDVEVNVNRTRQRLRPEELPALDRERVFDADFVNVEYGTSRWDLVSISGDTSVGKRVNFQPAPGREPELLDWVQSRLGISLRPLERLTIGQTLLYSRFDDEATGAPGLEDWIVRTRLNWQFTRALSLRAILQLERTGSDPALTSVTDRENWNTDLLFTYRLDPWTALYVGYNDNRRNVAIAERDGMPRLVRTDELASDGRQVIVKWSYLLRW